jgi:hypothetical protein
LMRSVSIWPVSFSAENFNSENKMRSRFRNWKNASSSIYCCLH